jgi:hypothetical protein
MAVKTQQILIHVFGCICFLALPFIFRPGKISEWNLFNDPRSATDFIVYLLLIVFFYLNFYLLAPQFFFTRKYLQYISIVVACFLFISFFPDFVMPHRPMRIPGMEQHRPPPEGSFFFDKTSRHFFIFLAVLSLSLLLKISTRWRIAEKEKLNTELSYLRSQVNPHFLFNTLNSIYSLAIEKSDDTATAIVKLSAMMRYVLNDTSKNFVPLQRELEYMEDYISFQRLRFGDTIPLSFDIEGNAGDKQIAPLILMSFVENAFKHGINAAESSEVKIEITINNNNLVLSVFNKKVTMQITDAHSGVGIANTKKRLELLYPGNYTLSVANDKDFFSVLLQINFA